MNHPIEAACCGRHGPKLCRGGCVRRARFLGLALMSLGGCATGVALPPAGFDHPANPDAPAGPLPAPSTALQAEPVPQAVPSSGADAVQDHVHHH
jgi:hypothetical protein